METKSLLYGLIGFFLGGLLVSVAATTLNKPDHGVVKNANTATSSTSMEDMTTSLKSKTGDEFDEAFIESMIAHHEGAVEMAKLSEKNSKHDEIKKLSQNIIAAQEKEIADMKEWQGQWGYASDHMMHTIGDTN